MNSLEKAKVSVAIELLKSAMEKREVVVTAEEILFFLEDLDNGRKL